MPPAKRKGRGAGASGSQSRRGRAPASRPTPAVTIRSSAAQAEPSSSPQSGKRSRAADKSDDEVKPSKRAKKTNARSQKDADAGSASVVSSQADTAAVASPTAAAAQVVSDRAPSEEEGSAAAPDAAASDSDQVSSPLRRPYLPRAIKMRKEWSMSLWTRLVSVLLDEKAKYKSKLDRQKKLLALDKSGPITCLDDESLFPNQESATETIFQTAKAVLGLTSYIGSNSFIG
ncbi:uncharacterized protein [Miscanthus floridulus]|uniref:uncharacterized protein isoform X2 n=1 Tax=Miscanthus floridulus TaxID=154761 RepID=UPI00345841D9